MAPKFLKTRNLFRRSKRQSLVEESQPQNDKRQSDLDTENTSFPFLELPAELRLHIYSYLVPNAEVAPRFRLPEAIREDEPRYILRKDNQPCCPAILRVSRQVHKEVADLWYGSVTYCMTIRDGRIFFLGADNYHTRGQLPPTIRDIQSLKLCINFRRWHRQPRGHGPWPSCTKLFVNSLLSGNYKLRSLELQFGGSTDEARTFFGQDTCKTALLQADLEWNLAPLRALRGVALTYREMLLGGPRSDNDWSSLPLQKTLWPLEPETIRKQQSTLEMVIKKFMERLTGEMA